MALTLTRYGAGWTFGSGDTTGSVRSVSVQKKYGSEVEVVNGAGVIDDVIYSGAETTTSTVTASDTVDALGGGSLTTGIVTRSSIQFSNEDVNLVSTETLSIPL